MKEDKAPSEETAMVVYKPWSTFPRGKRFMIKTQHPVAAANRESCTEVEEAFQKQSTNEENSVELLSDLPEHMATSLLIVLCKSEQAIISQDERDEHVYALASYFASSVSQDAKLARLKILVTLVTPQETASWQLLDPILRDTLRFITHRSFDWPHAQHSAHVVLLELRAMCLYIMEQQSVLVKSSEVAAGCIFGAARLVEHGLTASIPLIHCGLDLAGNQAKHFMTPVVVPSTQTRDQIVTKTYTGVAKRATDGVRETARWTAHSIRDVSTTSIYKIAQRFDDERLGERLVPDEGHRNVLVAAGTVGIASLGAAAIVGEAVVTTSASVAVKSASVAADVVRYKYGDHAGQVVEDASHTTGNIVRTVAHIAMLETSVLAKVVAKETVVGQAKKSLEGVEEISTAAHDYQSDSLTALKAGSFQSHLTKVDPQAAALAVNNRIKAGSDAAPTEQTLAEKPSSSSEEASTEKEEDR